MNQAIFLDKDGTLIQDIPYNVDPKKVVLLPFVGEGLHMLSSLGYQLIIISNQSGIARGYFNEEDLKKVYERLKELLTPYSVSFAGFYYCPHDPMGRVAEYKKDCECRKPSPGLLYRASEDQDIMLTKSWMIGDILDDCEAGRRAGCKTILINNGNETKWNVSSKREPHFIASTFLDAAEAIFNRDIKQNELDKRKGLLHYE